MELLALKLHLSFREQGFGVKYIMLSRELSTNGEVRLDTVASHVALSTLGPCFRCEKLRETLENEIIKAMYSQGHVTVDSVKV